MIIFNPMILLVLECFILAFEQDGITVLRWLVFTA